MATDSLVEKAQEELLGLFSSEHTDTPKGNEVWWTDFDTLLTTLIADVEERGARAAVEHAETLAGRGNFVTLWSLRQFVDQKYGMGSAPNREEAEPSMGDYPAHMDEEIRQRDEEAKP